MNAFAHSPHSRALPPKAVALPAAPAMGAAAAINLPVVEGRTRLKTFPIRWSFRRQLQHAPASPFDNTHT